MLRFRNAALLIAACLLIPASAVTQEVAVPDAGAAGRIANGSKFGNWVVSCQALAVNETTCVLSQQLLRANDNAFLAELLAFWNADGTQKFMAVRVPTGVYLPSGFALRPEDESEETRFVRQTCGRDLCEGLIEVTDDLEGRWVGAEKLLGGYRPGRTAEALVFTLSLAGLTEGLAALRVAPAE